MVDESCRLYRRFCNHASKTQAKFRGTQKPPKGWPWPGPEEFEIDENEVGLSVDDGAKCTPQGIRDRLSRTPRLSNPAMSMNPDDYGLVVLAKDDISAEPMFEWKNDPDDGSENGVENLAHALIIPHQERIPALESAILHSLALGFETRPLSEINASSWAPWEPIDWTRRSTNE